MSSFGDQVRGFNNAFQAKSQAHFVNVASAVKDSITDGSAVTGAPGQPVDTGNLKASWTLDFPSATEAMITTQVVYAPSIEDGVSYAHGGTPLTLRSQVGGFHSVALTVAGFDRIVADELVKLEGQ